ncbi:MAG: pantoate--beta-alanine ligase [Gemmatimonadota bacterium]
MIPGEGRPAVARTREELDKLLAEVRASGKSVALVPTMGSLHSGHLTLFDRAAALGDVVAASIFVNPLQFGLDEDYARYPRDLGRDADLAGSRGVSLVFAPDESVMYPDGAALVRVSPGPLGERLCGPYRPGHFEAVLTVVAKLFGIVRPDFAVFGRKDLQQAVLIGRMVKDLELGVRIEIAPLVRDEDGLALSSRNAYLSDQERAQALGLSQALAAADGLFRSGEISAGNLIGRFAEVAAGHPGLTLQYAELVDPETLEAAQSVTVGTVLAVAAFVGRTRLIDNLVLGAKVLDPRIPLAKPVEAKR